MTARSSGGDRASTKALAPPLVFLHGVFLDRSLWDEVRAGLADHAHVAVDMPSHGESGDVGRDWTIDECATMLIEILDALEIECAVAVGQSWGAMTALRAAHAHPRRFAALALCNMPFRRSSILGRTGFQLQKILTSFPRVYARQAAKSLYARASLEAHPEWSEAMQDRLAARPAREIARVLDAVILEPGDATPLIESLQVPALAVVGEHDYVGAPPRLETVTVSGGHVSPHEAPAETLAAIRRALELAEA